MFYDDEDNDNEQPDNPEDQDLGEDPGEGYVDPLIESVSPDEDDIL